MLELGQLSEDELAKLEKDRSLPLNAKIAISRIRAAMAGGRDANGAADIVLDRTEGKVPQPIEGDFTETKRIVLIFPEAGK